MQKEKLRQYLEIYRALEGYEEVEEYIRVLEEGPKGRSIERILSAIFEAVLKAEIDPENVDLRKFLRAYREVISKRDDIDYFFAGRLILYSWEIIKAQVETILSEMIPKEERVEEVEKPKREEVIPVVIRKERRPITLMEILEAVKEAERRIRRERKKRMRNLPIFQEISPEEVAHEDLGEETKRVYAILKRERGRTSVEEICKKYSMDLVTVFLALLFLAFEGKILLFNKGGKVIAEAI